MKPLSVTKEELEVLYVSQLRRLAEFYDLDLPSRMLKADIIDAIVAHTEKDLAYSDGEYRDSSKPQYSVRIKRIRESNKEK